MAEKQLRGRERSDTSELKIPLSSGRFYAISPHHVGKLRFSECCIIFQAEGESSKTTGSFSVTGERRPSQAYLAFVSYDSSFRKIRSIANESQGK